MELQPVACANCGAPLSVPGEVRFVTCNHCNSTLEIRRTESVTYSEKIAQIDVRTERIESQLESMRLERELEEREHNELEVMRLERELETCDQEWGRNQPDYHVRRFRLVMQLSEARKAASP